MRGGAEDAVIDRKTARSRWSGDQVQVSGGQLLLYHELATESRASVGHFITSHPRWR